MKKKGILSVLEIPTEPKDLFPWVVQRLVVSAGLGNVLGIGLLVLAGISLLGFLVGDYQSTGDGTVGKNGNIQFNSATKAKEQALFSHDTEVADAWQQGLSAAQIAQVQEEQAGLPAAVLLAVGKVENNLSPPDAHRYASYLQSQFVWQTYDDVTIHYWTTRSKNGHIQHHQSETITPVTMLLSANVWDGSLTNHYHWVSRMVGNTDRGTYTREIEWSNTQRNYRWSRVWSLLQHIPAHLGGHTQVLQKSKTNRQLLAALMAAVDDTLSDPYVQAMVDVVDYSSGVVGLGGIGPIAPPSGNVIQNILRYRSYIEKVAHALQIPAVLIAGVIYQESGGREHGFGPGGILTSSAGAMGLMQVEPSTAAGLVVSGVPVGNQAMSDLSNASMNILLGSLYLSELYHQFGENVEETLSAYNAGGGAEEEALAQGYTVAQNSQTLQYVQAIAGSWIPALQKYFGDV
ncbi:lytic transglycosylase domain-containing protein [Alicyclobacillus tolerans]|uniref:lytic transglycosylase domain-containing protein n=1 Tax=Alicyclobacillus tolerans TaxID=90970 RepID=UPI003B7E5957